MAIITGSDGKSKKVSKIFKINEEEVRDHLGEMVRDTVEETINNLLDAEAERLCNAKRHERTSDRRDYRSGHYDRKLLTRAGEVKLRVPKLRKLPFETEIIRRYQRRECSVEEALIQMYVAGVSVRRVEDITEALWGARVSAGTVSDLNKQLYEKIEEWRNEPIEGEFAYVQFDGISLKRSWGGEVRNVSILIAVGIDAEGYRTVLGVSEGMKEDKESWREFLRHLKSRGLKGVKLITSDKCRGLVDVVGEFFGNARWQRCLFHWHNNVTSRVPRRMLKEVTPMLKAIHAQEDREEALKKAERVVEKLRIMRLDKAATIVEEGIEETLTYMSFPREHWRKIRTNNPLERVMREIRRRTNVVGNFPDGKSALMLVAARLRYVTGSKWGTVKYMNMKHLRNMENEMEGEAAAPVATPVALRAPSAATV